jgi:hypothetical protein
MIMSSFAKIEMSSFKGIIMVFFERGHYGRRGHDHGTSEGIKAFIRDEESAGQGDHPGSGLRDSILEFEADPKDPEASKTGRRPGSHSPIER